MDNQIIAITADHHTNSTVALCPPVVNLDDGGTYHVSRSQRWLWECWLDYWENVQRLGDNIIAPFNGDLGELDTKRRTVQLISANKATIQNMAREVLEPAMIAKRLVFIRGTPAHQGKACWLEEAIAQDYDNAMRQSKTVASWYHWRAVVSGVRLDIAHHAPMSGDPQTAPNSANGLARRALWHYNVQLNQPAPHLIFRSHNHRKADSYDNYPTRAIFTPCFSLATEYCYRTGRELSLADIGGIAIECVDNAYTIHKYVYEPKENRQVWALKISLTTTC
jgi:hypothetical protein